MAKSSVVPVATDGIESVATGVSNLVAPAAAPVQSKKSPHGSKLATIMKDIKDPSDATASGKIAAAKVSGAKNSPSKTPRKKGMLRRLKPILGL
jgi:hypothetical protein